MIRAILHLTTEAIWALVFRFAGREPAPREEGWWLEGEQGRDEATARFKADAKVRADIQAKLRRDLGKGD